LIKSDATSDDTDSAVTNNTVSLIKLNSKIPFKMYSKIAMQ